MNLIDILNFQPFGDHGVMSLLSIRVIHMVMLIPVVYMLKNIRKDFEKQSER